jgi:hypothetical protein
MSTPIAAATRETILPTFDRAQPAIIISRANARYAGEYACPVLARNARVARRALAPR